MAAGLRQRAGPGIGGGVPASGRARAGADHQPEPRSGRSARRWTCRSSIRRSRRGSWSTAPATRTSGRATELADELGGLPLALEQAAAYIQATGATLAGYLSLFRRTASGPAGPWRGRPGTPADGSGHLGAGVGPTRAGRAGARRDCCGCWRACAPEAIPLNLLLRRAQARREAWPAGGAALVAVAGDRWRPATRSRRCAAIRWSPRPGTGQCRCTGWCRPSLSPRCRRSWPRAVAAGRRGLGRGRSPRQYRTAGSLAGMRAATAARPGCPQPDERRHVADRSGTSGIAAATPAARDLFQLIADAHARMSLRP